jgi:hypothetical protein
MSQEFSLNMLCTRQCWRLNEHRSHAREEKDAGTAVNTQHLHVSPVKRPLQIIITGFSLTGLNEIFFCIPQQGEQKS